MSRTARQRWIILGSAVALVVAAACAPLVVPALPSISVRGEWVAYGVLAFCLAVLVWARVTAVREQRRERGQR